MHLGTTGPIYDTPVLGTPAIVAERPPDSVPYSALKKAVGAVFQVAMFPAGVACRAVAPLPADSVEERNSVLYTACYGESGAWFDLRPSIVGGVFSLAIYYGIYKLVTRKS
jgi:hypothetical protein